MGEPIRVLLRDYGNPWRVWDRDSRGPKARRSTADARNGRASRKRTSSLPAAAFISEGVRAFICTYAIWREKVWKNLRNPLPQLTPPEPGKPPVRNQRQLTPPSGGFRNPTTQQNQTLTGRIMSTPLRGFAGRGSSTERNESAARGPY